MIEQAFESWVECLGEWYSQVSYPNTKMDAVDDPGFLWTSLDYYCNANSDVHNEDEQFQSVAESVERLKYIVIDAIEDIVDRYMS